MLCESLPLLMIFWHARPSVNWKQKYVWKHVSRAQTPRPRHPMSVINGASQRDEKLNFWRRAWRIIIKIRVSEKENKLV